MTKINFCTFIFNLSTHLWIQAHEFVVEVLISLEPSFGEGPQVCHAPTVGGLGVLPELFHDLVEDMHAVGPLALVISGGKRQ